MSEEKSSRDPAGAPRNPNESMSLLTDMMRNTLDEGYTAVAERNTAKERSRRGSAANLIGVLALFAVLATVAAVETNRAAPAEAEERSQLIERIDEESSRVERLRANVTSLEEDVDELRGELQSVTQDEQGLQSRVLRLGVQSGSIALEGPGLRITVDDSSYESVGDEGTVRDTDLHALVGSLWVAGAEAVAINQQRITSTTAIRGAGKAITVNFRPLSRPYVVRAIGNPAQLEARLLETDGGQAWVDLQAVVGVRFDRETSGDLSLPGRTMRQPRVAEKGTISP